MTRKCRVAGCDTEMRHPLFCERHWSQLGDGLLTIVDRIYPEAQMVYFGRTNYPALRLLEHREQKGLTRMAVLHWATCRHEAAVIEAHLLEACVGLPARAQ